MSWTIEEARSVSCPECGAGIGEPCSYTGKGAVKAMRIGRSHQKRIDVMVSVRPSKRKRGRNIERQKNADLSQDVVVIMDE